MKEFYTLYYLLTKKRQTIPNRQIFLPKSNLHSQSSYFIPPRPQEAAERAGSPELLVLLQFIRRFPQHIQGHRHLPHHLLHKTRLPPAGQHCRRNVLLCRRFDGVRNHLVAAEKVVFESEAAALHVEHLDQTERGFAGGLHDHGCCRDDSCAGVLAVG